MNMNTTSFNTVYEKKKFRYNTEHAKVTSLSKSLYKLIKQLSYRFIQSQSIGLENIFTWEISAHLEKRKHTSFKLEI